MKRKVLLVILFLMLAMFLSGCCLFENLSADVAIEDWEQNYDDYSGEWDHFVKVQFKICNTGAIEISHYIVWFTAYCEDGSTYEHWTNGIYIYVGDCNSGTCYINVGPNKEVISVRATDRKLEHWDYPNQ